MNYVNLRVKYLRSPEFIGSKPSERATWIALLAYCAEQENSGVIENCGAWKSRMWEQMAGVTRDEIDAKSALWHFDGNTLVVKFYPVYQQEEVARLREVGKQGGRGHKKPCAKP